MTPTGAIDRSLLRDHPVIVAPRLLGVRLVSDVGRTTAVIITEVEAYHAEEPASHSHGGLTRRNRSMFEDAGTLYVYRSYGIHWCANVVTGEPGDGAAVLLRAGRPVEGLDVMHRRRGRADHVADGPGKLCQALGITGEHDGVDLLGDGPIRLEPGNAAGTVEATRRIGISKARELAWRFVSLDR